MPCKIFRVTKQMYPGGYTVEVTCLSPNATEKEVYDFFSHCGAIEYVEILRCVDTISFWILKFLLDSDLLSNVNH